MLTKRIKNKLPALKRQSSFRFSTSNSPLTQCREEPKDHMQHCIKNNPHPEISCFLQKGFSVITEQSTGKSLHALCIKCSTPLSIFHTNTLISMYSGFEKIDYAQRVFDRMPDRNVASWNNMISGYVKMGMHIHAYELFLEMWARGFELNGYNISSLLTAFSRSGSMLLEGLQIHSLLVKRGLIHNVYVGTSLLHFYGGYGLIHDARVLFEGMPEKNVVSWTSLMVNYANGGSYLEVVELYRTMRCEGVSSNQNTFTTVISSCAALDDECSVLQVLGHVTKLGLLTDVSVANSLIFVFGGFGRIEVADYVFNSMQKCDTISWNSILAAHARNWPSLEMLRYFHLMRLNHGKVDESTLSTLLSVSGAVDNLSWGRGIHALLVKMGLELDICLSNALLTMYFETGSHTDAEKVFHGIAQKDLISWNSMMAGYVSLGMFLDALRVFRKLIGMENFTNFVSFASALSACANAVFMSEGKIVHSLAVTSGLHQNTVVGNALVTMYGKCGATLEAKKVFQNMPENELVTWNALIGSYAENEEADEAIKNFNSMRESGVSPNYITLVNMLGSCCDPCDLRNLGTPLHALALLAGFELDVYMRNSLISMYAKCGDLDSSNSIFHSLVSRTSATWSAMVAANAHNGQWEESLRLMVEMQRAEVKFDQFSLSAALSASANLAGMEAGQHLHCASIKLGFNSFHFVSNATMDMYGKCGKLDDLQRLLPEPKARTRLSWNILISALARHGSFWKAQEAFREMAACGLRPDHVTFVSLLSACSHGGLVEEGLNYFRSMTGEFSVPPAIEHCVCMVDLLGRSGRLSEAEAFIQEMPVPPNDFIWRTLLSACKTHGNLELGKKASRKLLEANPSDDSAYVLYSNVCATSGRWSDMVGVRVKMQTENVRKKPAYSWLNVRDRVSSFGENTRKLREVRRETEEAGYVANYYE